MQRIAGGGHCISAIEHMHMVCGARASSAAALILGQTFADDQSSRAVAAHPVPLARAYQLRLAGYYMGYTRPS